MRPNEYSVHARTRIMASRLAEKYPNEQWEPRLAWRLFKRNYPREIGSRFGKIALIGRNAWEKV